MKKIILVLGLCLLAFPSKSEALVTYSWASDAFEYRPQILSAGVNDAFIDNNYVAWAGDECGTLIASAICQAQVSYFDGQNIFKLTNYAEPDLGAGESPWVIEDFKFTSGQISWKTNEVFSTYHIPGYTPAPQPKAGFKSYIVNDQLYIDDGKEIINLTDAEGKVRIGNLGEYPDFVSDYDQSGNQLLFSSYNTFTSPAYVYDAPQIAWFDYDLQHVYLDQPYSSTSGSVVGIQVSNNYAIYQNQHRGLYFMTYNKPSTSTIPEPATMASFGTGLLGFLVRRRFRV